MKLETWGRFLSVCIGVQRFEYVNVGSQDHRALAGVR